MNFVVGMVEEQQATNFCIYPKARAPSGIEVCHTEEVAEATVEGGVVYV